MRNKLLNAILLNNNQLLFFFFKYINKLIKGFNGIRE